MARTSIASASSFNIDLSADHLPDQELLPPPSIDNDKIAPWLNEPTAEHGSEPPAVPPKTSRSFGFPHKSSFSTFGASTLSLRSSHSRPSDAMSFDSSTTFVDSLRPVDTRKPKSALTTLTSMVKKARSRSKLRPDLRINSSSSSDPIPPLPSPDYIPFPQQQKLPPSPPPPPQQPPMSKKERSRAKKKLAGVPPPLPPKDIEPEFKLDTNLESMEGIIDLTIRADGQLGVGGTDPSSPSSGFESSTNHSSDPPSSQHSQHLSPQQVLPGRSPSPHAPPSGAATFFSNPFVQPNVPSELRGVVPGPHLFDGRNISPTTRPSVVVSPDEVEMRVTAWTAPESWAVDKEGVDVTAVPDYSSSEESGAIKKRRRRKAASNAGTKANAKSSEMYRIRIYRANNSYHVVSVELSVTVAELAPMLNRKLILDPEREPHCLYLKERGRERILAPTERPAEILRRRLEQTGYTLADALEMLGREDIQFLMKFVYKSNVLGPTEDDLEFPSSEYIDLTGRSLRAIPILLYSRAESIISLNLSRNPMLEIPRDFIHLCVTLRELRLSNMAMKKVPQSVRHCATLHRLDLSSNRIVDLDDAGLDWIPDLRYLKIQNNRMERLPWYFPRLHALKELNISNNKFRHFPEVVTKLTSLVDLDISFNMISDLPDEIGQLTSLERLIIVGNQVSKFPLGCSSLSNLATLDCRRNNISDLSAVCLLPKLQDISTDHNAIHALDLSFGPHLQELDASHNDITQLTLAPGPIGQPYALKSLDISHAKLSSLDDLALSHLTSLRTLKIDHNSIRSLPDALGDLAYLVHLSCSNNQLYALPATIGRLQRLEKLEAHNNSLKELPSSLWECASLMLINCTSNLLSSFNEPDLHGTPPAPGSPPVDSPLSSLPRHTLVTLCDRKTSASSVASRSLPPLAYALEKLYLGENRLIEDVLHPLTLLRELKVLNLSFNDIQEIPPSFFKNLVNLEELYLSGNKLSVLPTEDLHRLTNLQVLFLNGNKLTTLPQELGKIQTLSVLDVGSNVLRYNIHNWEFDWNWNFNKNLRYLNLSGNKRLEIKPDAKAHQNRDQPDRKMLSDFSSLSQLKILGLMDVTTTFANNIPDDNEERRVRTSLTEVNRMAYGIADTLGQNLTMFDFVKPEFRDKKNEALFAMFGRATHVGSSSRLSKFLHDQFGNVFQAELDLLQTQKGEGVSDAMRRAFLKTNKLLHDHLYSRDTRKPSTVSASGSIPSMIDIPSIRSGASGIVLYFVDKTLYAANAGSSLAVVSRQGTAELLSKKHDPFARSETARIRAAEGWVSPKGCVNEDIDVSRSFGFYYMLPIVNARPDIMKWELSELDEFVIIGNSGLWDFVSYQTAVDIARSERADPMIAAQKLRDFAISYGAEGSTMIMVISVADLFYQGTLRSRQPTVDSLIDADTYLIRRRPKKDEIINKDISRLDDEVSPPTQHLALVFTDIRNSTHLWEVNAGMSTAMVLHNNLLRRQLRFCGGYEVKTEGDAFMCSFPTVLSALWWCLSVQVQLLQVPWPLEILECEDGKEVFDAKGRLVARGLSVRMGLHCGEPVCEPDPITHRMDYFGPMVNRSARICGVAAGGQLMCSANVIREINARIFETEPHTDQSYLQPPQAIEAIRRLGLIIVPVGEVKLKGLEVPEVLSLIYPSELEGRQELDTADSHPGASGSRVQFSVQQMRDLALLCIRLETLTSSRVFRPLPERKGSSAKPPEEEPSTNPVFLYGNLDVLIPAMDKASDAELTLLLDSLALRIENALASLTLKQIVALNKTDKGDPELRRNGSGLDVRTLQHLLSFLNSS